MGIVYEKKEQKLNKKNLQRTEISSLILLNIKLSTNIQTVV